MPISPQLKSYANGTLNLDDSFYFLRYSAVRIMGRALYSTIRLV
jgi:hypothetical protein